MTRNNTPTLTTAPGSYRLGTGWAHRHDACITAYRKGETVRRQERAILSLADGIDAYISGAVADGPDYIRAGIVWQLLQAFGSSLDFDLGQLDGGTLSAWQFAQAERYGIDGDTGEPLPYAIARDGETLAHFSDEGDALAYLHRVQGQSAAWATAHEGWAMLHNGEPVRFEL